MTLKTIAKWMVRLILVAFLGLVLAALTVLVVLPRATHGTALTVLTGSMTPKLAVGSVVIDRPVDTRTLKIGDIATYQKTAGKAEYITHRIVAINTKTDPVTFTFKGDANRGPDVDPVPATAVRGKVWFDVPYLGTIRDSLRAGGLRSWALILAIIALVGYAAAQFVGVARSRRRDDPPEQAELTLEFSPAAFDELDADVVASVLHGRRTSARESEPAGDLVTLVFIGTAEQLCVIERLLAPFSPTVVRTASGDQTPPQEQGPVEQDGSNSVAVLGSIERV